LLDDDRPLISDEVLAAFASTHSDAQIETVPDTNHYTILVGAGVGPSHVADAIRAAVKEHVA
jgi:hypothetical protein